MNLQIENGIPLFSSDTKKIIFRSVLIILTFLWLMGIFSTLFIQQNNIIIFFYPFINHSYSLVCHQESAKSFFIDGHQLLVCSRCMGIYSGAFLSACVMFFFNPSFIINKKYLGMALAGIFFDVIMVLVGLYSYNKISATVTGAFFGSIVFIYISAVIEKSTFIKN